MPSFSAIRLLGAGYLSLAALLCGGQSSVLNSGPWYKVAVENRGVYKITYDQLKKMGFDPASDPRKIRIYGQGGGMLPQRNSEARPVGLVENAIIVSGESDGVFDKDDYILFFAEGPDNVRYDLNRKIFSYQSNLYSDKNFYFVTVSSDNGKRIAESENIQGTFPVIQHFDDYVYHEADEYNELQSGREWFGERYDLVTSYAYRFDVSGVLENSSIKIVSDVMAQSFNGSSFKLLFNKAPIGEQVVPTISNTQYSIKGRHKRDTITIDANTVSAPASSTQEVQYQYVKASSGKSVGFLDFLLINFSRHLALYGDQTIFTASSSLDHPISQYVVGGVNENCSIWDITNTSDIKSQSFNLQSETATFSTTSDVLREFVVFNTSVPSPELIGYVLNQNLHGISPVNLIVVANPAFKGEAGRLASHRQTYSGWSTAVVTPEEIYNEFSSGRQDVTAIRDFVKHMYDKNPGVLKALLIVGKGSYDYKDRMPNNTNFVPTYESRNSLAPLETYSSDDYFAFLENHEGNWGEGPIENHTLEIGVGRLPVKTTEEAKNVVDKIIDYDSNKKNYGSWRKDVVFVADDGSTSDGFTSTHQNQANIMAESIEEVHGSFDTKKIFLGTYTKTVKPNGEVIPEANRDIASWFDRGSVVINYTGHGSEKLLADERVFTVDDITALENESYPFMVTATCEFGRQDDPAVVSSAELTVIQPKGGTIGLVTTARPVNSPTNFLLNQEFYSSLFEREQGKYIPLGEVFKRTKNSSMSGVSNRNFSLLGDPSMTLALPTNSISISGIETSTGSDTL
ncbi:MAG TPA: type IX secretion system sortase PorU, partial [Chryseolinea sp.]